MPSRKYLLKGFNDSDVQAYYNYQVNMAVLLGADRDRAKQELKESIEFEIQIANVWNFLYMMSLLLIMVNWVDEVAFYVLKLEIIMQLPSCKLALKRC